MMHDELVIGLIGHLFVLSTYVVEQQQKSGQLNQLQIIMHQLCCLGIETGNVYLACCKCFYCFNQGSSTC